MSEKDSIRNFRFKVGCNGVENGGFNEVAGFDLSIDVVEYREGELPIQSDKLLGDQKHGNITLKAGIVDETLYSWISECVKGNVAKQIFILNAYGETDSDTVIASWSIQNAWPVKYTAPDFNSVGNDVAVESLEIAHEGIKRLV